MTDRKALYAFLPLLLLGSVGAKGASFDCSKAKAQREHLICDNAELSSADEQLALTYKAALEKLPPSNKALMQQGQREWLGYIGQICGTKHYGISDGKVALLEATPQDVQKCLLAQYKTRTEAISTSILETNGLSIQRIDSFRARKSKDTESHTAGYATTEISYPQIFAPLNSDSEAWNRHMKDRLGKQSKGYAYTDNFDFSAEYKISVVSSNIISTTFDYFYYPHGAAHGQPWTLTDLWVLDKQRPFEATDLFDPAKDWKDGLAKLAFDALMAKNDKEQGMYDAKDPGSLNDIVSNPNRWTLERDGLGIKFNVYEVGPYVAGAPKVTIPWSDLSQFLSSSAPAPQ